MRTILSAIGLAVFVSALSLAAQPNKVGNINASRLVLDQRTIAQMNGLTPDTTGQMILCIDCIRSSICVSSGVNRGAWVIAVATGTKAGSTFSGFEHCQ